MNGHWFSHFPPGGPLVEIVGETEIEVKLGVEAEDLSAVHEGAPITIVPVNDPTAAKVEGSVRLITRRIDPTTRLVDVYVALPQGTKLLLDQYVRGEIQHTEKDALVVARCLEKYPHDHATALKQYEAARRERAVRKSTRKFSGTV